MTDTDEDVYDIAVIGTDMEQAKSDAKNAANNAINKLSDYANDREEITTTNKAVAQALVTAANDAVDTYVNDFGGKTSDFKNYGYIAVVQDKIDAVQ